MRDLAENARRVEIVKRNQALGIHPLESLPCEKLAQGLDENAPYLVSAVLEGEIKNLHKPFEAWLKLNADALRWIHSRPYMPSTTEQGLPDFVVIGFQGRIAMIEFKAREHPEKWKKREWTQKLWAKTCSRMKIPYAVTNDLQVAVALVKEHLLAFRESA